jgi:hypothetical protein
MVLNRLHGGHWSVIAALVGIAAIIAAARVTLEPGQPDIAVGENLQHENTKYRPGGPQCDPQWLAQIAGIEANGIRQACAEAAEEHRLKANDLIQQTRSANAANEQARIARVGAFFGILTFIAAVVAASFAGFAAFETRIAARAALGAEAATRDANDISRQAYLADNRPWLSMDTDISILRISDDEADAAGTVTIRNHGSTPAILADLDCHLLIGQPLYEELGEHVEMLATLIRLRPGGGLGEPVFPTQAPEKDFYASTRITPLEDEATKAGPLSALLVFLIRYSSFVEPAPRMTCIVYRLHHQRAGATSLFRQGGDAFSGDELRLEPWLGSFAD